MTPPLQRYPLVLRLLLMFSMFLFNISVVSYLALTLAQSLFNLENINVIAEGSVSTPAEINAFLLIQAISSLGGFLLTAMMFAVLESGEYKHHLRLNTFPSLKMVLLAVAAVIVSQFFIEYLVSVNQSVELPANLQFLKEYQQKTEALTEKLMNFTGVGQFIIVSIVVALIPAIGEEFFFRGLILGDLLRGKVRAVIAIPATGFLFAISHFQYDNVLAIWILGSFLGYLYYVSGSLWLPIAAHFTNNFLAVLLKYLFNLGYISKEFAEAQTPLYLTLISVAVFAVFIFLFHKWKNPDNFVEPVEEEEEVNNVQEENYR